MKNDNQSIIVAKLNLQREETWRYEGNILEQREDSLLIEAYFNREDLSFHGITLQKNDRFLERYYLNRWYNIFQIHDREDDRIKGWYCNICQPAEFSDGKVTYVDLALDLLVYPDGSHLVLDEDEYRQLGLSEAEHLKAQIALTTLIDLAVTNRLAKEFIYHA